EKREHEARVAAEKQQPAATNNLDAWYAMIDARLEQHFFSGDLGVGGAFKGAIGEALGRKAGQVRDEMRSQFKRADEELQRVLEAKLAALEERQVASVSSVDTRIEASLARVCDDLIEATGGPQGQVRLREEFKRALEELTDACGREIAAL